MKQNLIKLAFGTAFALLAFAYSCTSSEPVLPDQSVKTTLEDADIRTESQMQDFAVSAYSSLYPSKSREALQVESVKRISSKKSSRSSDNTTSLYAVNFADSSGYVIVTDNPNVEPVMAVIEHGNYSEDNSNATMDYFLRAAEKYASLIDRPGVTIVPKDTLRENLRYWELSYDTTEQANIAPKLETWWGQNGFYSYYCPVYYYNENAAVGCGPVALGLVLSYLEYPSLRITFDGRDELLNLYWDDIKVHKYILINCDPDQTWLGEKNCYATDETHYTIAKILRQMGHLSGTEYGNRYWQYGNSSRTTETGMISALNSLGLNHSGLQSYSRAYNALNENNILIMFGTDTSSDNQSTHSSHIFIVDGLSHLKYTETEYIYEIVLHRPELISTTTTEFYRSYVHVVWGLDEQGVGYYNDRVFRTKGAVSLDEDATPSKDDYKYNSLKYISVTK